MIGIILVSVLIAICIASIVNCINIALAQFNTNTPFVPSTGQSPSSLSPPLPSSSPSPLPSSSPSSLPCTGHLTKVNPANAKNCTIIAPQRLNTVGPSSLTASPITR
jgi:hypothetical protein